MSKYLGVVVTPRGEVLVALAGGGTTVDLERWIFNIVPNVNVTKLRESVSYVHLSGCMNPEPSARAEIHPTF